VLLCLCKLLLCFFHRSIRSILHTLYSGGVFHAEYRFIRRRNTTVVSTGTPDPMYTVVTLSCFSGSNSRFNGHRGPRFSDQDQGAVIQLHRRGEFKNGAALTSRPSFRPVVVSPVLLRFARTLSSAHYHQVRTTITNLASQPQHYYNNAPGSY
jgi:hypothetical protein